MVPSGEAAGEVSGRDDAATLVSRARAALAAEQWMEALDLASQALAADPAADGAATVIGSARGRLGSLSGVELRRLTIVAVDMAGSTAISAEIGPERYRELMLDLYDVCVEAVGRYDGRV